MLFLKYRYDNYNKKDFNNNLLWSIWYVWPKVEKIMDFINEEDLPSERK